MTKPLVEFDGAGDAAILRYDVPLPSKHTGRRVLEIDLGLRDADFLPAALSAGVNVPSTLNQDPKTGDVSDAGVKSYIELMKKAMEKIYEEKPKGAPGLPPPIEDPDWGQAATVESAVSTPVGMSGPLGATFRAAAGPRPTARVAASARSALLSLGAATMRASAVAMNYAVADPQGLVNSTREHLQKTVSQGYVEIPILDWAKMVKIVKYYLDVKPKGRFLLVEIYGISSFLGNYGVGRTVKTFTLLPGESTTIHMKTWRTYKETATQTEETVDSQATSIIDSQDEHASRRFAKSMQEEASDKVTSSSKENWHAEAEAHGSFLGFGGSVSGGGGGEYHSGREEFAKNAEQVTREHASDASSKREVSVTSKSEAKSAMSSNKEQTSGEEQTIERVIKNANMRRVLNFVFRELNQEYLTKIHLLDFRIAFTNGNKDSYIEVPISGLGSLLRQVLIPEAVNRTASKILDYIDVVFDHEDKPVKVLEGFYLNPATQAWEIIDPVKIDDKYPPPSATLAYRFNRGIATSGALGQHVEITDPDGESRLELAPNIDNPVPGVLMKQTALTLRTDSLIVEALLGQADALDPYAMEVQEASARAKTLENSREELAQATVAAIADPVDRAKAYAAIFNPQVVTKE